MIAFIASPFAVALAAVWLVRRFPRRSALLAVWPAMLAVLFANELRQVSPGAGQRWDWPWAPSLGLSLSFNLDGLGLLFAILITGIGALVVLYASRYLEGHAQAHRFFASLFAFMGAMLGVVLSDNVLTLFVFWELTGFTSFLLIGFEHDRGPARAAALQALIVTGAGGLALLAAGLLLIDASGTPNLSEMAATGASIATSPVAGAAAGLVLLAAFTKSAQVPFHFWLPNAMAAPTPVSAYLHSATMVKAGIYLIARVNPILGATPWWSAALTVAGATTMVVGAYRAVQETDLKRILAYSTVSALGVLTMLLGVGTKMAIVAALVYLVAHAAYKGALFLVAGGIDHATHTRDISLLGGLSRTMPWTAVAGGVAAISMAGIPATLGFVGKDAAYEALLDGTSGFPVLLPLMVSASALLGLTGLVSGVLPFRGVSTHADAAESPWPLWVPALLLALAGLLAGVAPSILDRPLAAAATAIMGGPVDVSLAVWHGFTPAVLLSALTLIVAGAGYFARHAIRTRLPAVRHGAEAIYDGALAALDATSRTIAPALHSASLRTYVMVIVITTVVVGGTGLLMRPAGWVASMADVRLYDVLVVFVIIAGAVSATRAKSTMSAVLSLGAVGYGVAVLFLSFGAPDLAMTQFSVETLTVLIYVLVFRHFPGPGRLSRRLVNVRDGLIAAAIGIFVTALLASVAMTETAPQLREFFAAFGPTLGHGRNIVNVILVDFRAFDTLGEITVLATAAIGVRGLLRFGADGRAPREAVQPMSSPIFKTAARLLMPLLMVFAVFLLLRGHNEPGGGFVGGLVASAGFALYAIAFGVHRAREALLVRPLTLLAAGLLIALTSGLPAAFAGQPFLTALWTSGPVAVGTPLLFDIGVFLVVTGVVLMMIFSLAEES